MNSTTTTDSPERDEVLRGFEIVKRGLFGELVSVMKFKPTIWGAKQCAASAKWLADRHPNTEYEMRAIVSVPRKDESAPLTLEADDDKQLEPPFTESGASL